MKARLLFRDQDPIVGGGRPEGSEDLVRDLGLNTLVNAMAAGDKFLAEVAERCLLAQPLTPPEIRYRQAVLRDCLEHPQAARELYELATAASEIKRRIRVGLLGGDYPSGILYRSLTLLIELTQYIKQLRQYSVDQGQAFASQGLVDLMGYVDRDLNDAYLAALEDHLRRLDFPTGIHLTARLGPGCLGTDYVLRRPASVRWSWRDLFLWSAPDVYTYRIPDRDEQGARTLSRLRDEGINLVADAAAQSAGHMIDFFTHLRWELGFYIGCLNVHDQLQRAGRPICMPDPEPAARGALEAGGLIDAGLALRGTGNLVGNDLHATGKTLIMITGANQGGKSTLIRAIGLAQLMMHAGMFVTANSYQASVATSVLTHYRREEDPTMMHGKLDEELFRMSALVDRTGRHAIVLFNESLACTNEREGSQIARQIIEALQQASVRVLYVTHMFSLAHAIYEERRASDEFLRAERRPDGRRTYKLIPGEPEPTSHGRDLYDQVFA